MSYYLVNCKFGHVGRNKYLPLEIPIIASSVKEASVIAKKCRGVKKNHKDWCLEVPKEVSYDTYKIAFEVYHNDVYFEKHSRSRLELFEERLVDEPNYTIYRDRKTNRIIHIKKRNLETIKYKKMKEYLYYESRLSNYQQQRNFSKRELRMANL